MIARFPQNVFRRFGLSGRRRSKLRAHLVRKRNGGMALVLVLGFLVLITGLIVAFFSNVTAELSGANSSVATLSTRTLAESTVHVVKGAIRRGTAKGTNYAWASQPGMIRVYDNAGAPYEYYKLYSSDNMIVPKSDITAFDPINDVDKDWATKTALFTDLNSPVMTPDPRNPTTYHPVFPILDPRAKITGNVGVDGFSFDTKFGANEAQDDTAILPMPVRWLYVLRDGTMTAPDDGATKALFTKSPPERKPTRQNPIVGRIAFWTDDESCKVNVNTASEGTYWDVPRVAISDDSAATGLAFAQPYTREYQRYPGHPATTCLSPVLGKLLNMTVDFPYPGNPSAGNATKLDPYYKLVPRVGEAPDASGNPGGSGGSKGGTIKISSGAPVRHDEDRLYASVDEFMFSAAPPTATTRVVNSATGGSGSGAFTNDKLERARFFLTANSSAPEITLFNTPRVSMWPISSPSSTYDDVIKFCSTIGGKVYYFTRSNPRSSTADYTGRNEALYKYLQTMTSKAVPGFGGGTQGFLTKYPSGSGAAAGPASDRDQILTSIFDYIRCTNIADASVNAKAFTPRFQINPPNDVRTYTDANVPAKAGEVVPIRINNTVGFGRYQTLSEADIVFFATQTKAVTYAPNPAAPNTKVTKTFGTAFRAIVLFEYSCPAQGMPGLRSYLKYRATGLDGLKVNGQSLFPKGSMGNYIEVPDLQTQGGRSMGGSESPEASFISFTQKKVVKDGAGEAKGIYPFVSALTNEIKLTPKGDGSYPIAFDFDGGNFTVDVLDADAKPTDTGFQQISFNFPPASNLRVPDSAVSDFNSRVSDKYAEQLWMATLIKGASTNIDPTKNTTPGDTMIAVEPAGALGVAPQPGADPSAGDIRMIAGLASVPAARFRAHNAYTMGTAALPLEWAMGMAFGASSNELPRTDPRDSLNTDVTKNVNGVLVAGYTHNGQNPNVPTRVGPTGVKRASASGGGPGDWDTGVGNMGDGAYINKPDEGDLNVQSHVPYQQGGLNSFAPAGADYFSPNRQVSSSMMLGSIPTGVQRFLPWQTLLFNPKPEDASHPGHGTPLTGPPYTTLPDHLIADLFWMPVVEPYAISQPMSTAGKINMNYQIVPFTFITRSTAIQAVMKSTKFLAIPASDALTYKDYTGSGAASGATGSKRYSINADETLKAFEAKFTSKDVFRSATQISEINLVPLNPQGTKTGFTYTDQSMKGFWNANTLTGDNVREKPYADLYARLTTKSNAYTVHFRVQSLRQAVPTSTAGSDARWAQWDEIKDRVTGEYRGSSIIERYIDPNDTTLADFATTTTDINQYYKFRTVSTKQVGQ